MFLFQPDFGAVVRTLTNFGPSMVPSFVAQTSIAAATTVNFSAGATNDTLFITSAFKTGSTATNTIELDLFDGTNLITLAQTAASSLASASFHGISGQTVFQVLKNNSATIAGTYMLVTSRFVH